MRHLRRKGFAHLTTRAISRITSPLYMRKRMYLFEVDLLKNLPAVIIPGGCTYRELFRDTYECLFPLVSKRRTALYRRRINQGAKCFAAICDGRVVSFVWASLTDIQDENYHFPIHVREGEAYSFDGYTDPDYRRRGVFMGLVIYQLHVLRSICVRRALVIQHTAEMVAMYPKYLDVGLSAKVLNTIDYRRVARWGRDTWSLYDGHLGLSGS